MSANAKSFGKKERVLNYASSNYQLTRPNKVGAVMALIRECQPKTLQEWEQYYFKNAYSDSVTNKTKITQEILDELGERLYAKIKEVVIPEWTEAFNNLTLQDCMDYIYELTVVRTYDGFLSEKSVIHDNLAKKFPEVVFEESEPLLDHAGDIDYIGKIGDKAFGIQIKPVTANSNFDNYKPSERMQHNFDKFEEDYQGKVFIIFSSNEGGKKTIRNTAVLDDIKKEIARLKGA